MKEASDYLLKKLHTVEAFHYKSVLKMRYALEVVNRVFIYIYI